MQLNKVFLIGNLTRDPETRHTQTGKQVTKFTIAVNDRRGGRDKGQDEAMFLRIETWGRTAEIADQYLQKGSQVLVDGRLKIEEYETRDGQKRRDPVIVADNIQLGARPRGDGDDSYRSSGSDRGSSRSREESRGVEEDSGGYNDNDAGSDEAPASSDTEDDLPF